MNSIGAECTELKAKYDDCFNAWFRESFLAGKNDHDIRCGAFFSSYQKCLRTTLEKQNLISPEIYTDILGTEKEKRE
ncbi:hypothetical protein EMCRGX_G023852 [Ephydatia muelleri]